MAKPASLTSGLVAKGYAMPTAHHSGGIVAVPAEKEAPVKRVAMTVKLEPSQYEELKIFAAKNRMKSQDIFVEALGKYLRDFHFKY